MMAAQANEYRRRPRKSKDDGVGLLSSSPKALTAGGTWPMTTGEVATPRASDSFGRLWRQLYLLKPGHSDCAIQEGLTSPGPPPIFALRRT